MMADILLKFCLSQEMQFSKQEMRILRYFYLTEKQLWKLFFFLLKFCCCEQKKYFYNYKNILTFFKNLKIWKFENIVMWKKKVIDAVKVNILKHGLQFESPFYYLSHHHFYRYCHQFEENNKTIKKKKDLIKKIKLFISNKSIIISWLCHIYFLIVDDDLNRIN